VPITIDASVHGTTARLAVTGTIALTDRHTLRDTIRRHVAIGTVDTIALDLSAVPSLDADGLGMLLACRRHVLGSGRSFRTEAISLPVTEFLVPTGVLPLLAGTATFAEIAEDADESPTR
jgi:anti-anti-sigma factor